MVIAGYNLVTIRTGRHNDCGAQPLKSDFSLFHEMMQEERDVVAETAQAEREDAVKESEQSVKSLHQSGSQGC